MGRMRPIQITTNTMTTEKNKIEVKITEIVKFEENTREYINSLHPSFATSTLYLLIYDEQNKNENGFTLKQIPVITNGTVAFEIGVEMMFLKMKYRYVEPTEAIHNIITKMYF